ncbi:hypothetical protein RFI_26260, partial [Reticulomyxa filosa]
NNINNNINNNNNNNNNELKINDEITIQSGVTMTTLQPEPEDVHTVSYDPNTFGIEEVEIEMEEIEEEKQKEIEMKKTTKGNQSLKHDPKPLQSKTRSPRRDFHSQSLLELTTISSVNLTSSPTSMTFPTITPPSTPTSAVTIATPTMATVAITPVTTAPTVRWNDVIGSANAPPSTSSTHAKKKMWREDKGQMMKHTERTYYDVTFFACQPLFAKSPCVASNDDNAPIPPRDVKSECESMFCYLFYFFFFFFKKKKRMDHCMN